MATLDDATRSAVLADLRAGKLIDAIKTYRRATGAGLADAKRDVEALGAANGIPVRRVDANAAWFFRAAWVLLAIGLLWRYAIHH